MWVFNFIWCNTPCNPRWLFKIQLSLSLSSLLFFVYFCWTKSLSIFSEYPQFSKLFTNSHVYVILLLTLFRKGRDNVLRDQHWFARKSLDCHNMLASFQKITLNFHSNNNSRVAINKHVDSKPLTKAIPLIKWNRVCGVV